MSWLIDPAQRILNGALDGLVARQGVVSANLANIDTPGYQPKAVDFESALRDELGSMSEASATSGAAASPPDGPSADVAMRSTDPRHFPLVSAGLAPGVDVRPAVETLRNDGNQVDLEAEMSALTDTQLRFEAVTAMTTGKLGMLNQAITGGR